MQKTENEEAESALPKEGKKREKSRHNPAHTLQETLEFLETVSQANPGPAFNREILTKALGHDKVSGTSNQKVASLLHFGLVTRNPGGRYSLSDVARKVLQPRTDDEKKQGVVEAAKQPALYSALLETYHEQSLPTPKLFTNILAREYGIVAKAAPKAEARFRATMEFAGLLRAGILYAELADDRASAESTPSPPVATGERGATLPDTSARKGERTSDAETKAMQSFTLPLNDGNVVTLLIPSRIDQSDLERIKLWIDLIGGVIARSEEPADSVH